MSKRSRRAVISTANPESNPEGVVIETIPEQVVTEVVPKTETSNPKKESENMEQEVKEGVAAEAQPVNATETVNPQPAPAPAPQAAAPAPAVPPPPAEDELSKPVPTKVEVALPKEEHFGKELGKTFLRGAAIGAGVALGTVIVYTGAALIRYACTGKGTGSDSAES